MDDWLLVVEEKVVVIDSVNLEIAVWRRNVEVAQESRFTKVVLPIVDGCQWRADVGWSDPSMQCFGIHMLMRTGKQQLGACRAVGCRPPTTPAQKS
ncbi:hypothetical protein RFN31_26800 [Mesorhizobium sp. VK3C]|nr:MULTISPECIES: hypothetical protein [unclassified Mesorhizobium]MDX8449218.1 hypothetical protein [Mesorhizobium sp. VK3C]MDX8522427.1 hypothetical protein [Mesorhizobium sp. VK23D]